LTPDWTTYGETGSRRGIERSQYYRALRVDAVQHNEKIDDRIVAEIRRSGLVVADFTGQRPGVYYEAGLARGLGIRVISTCRESETDKLHFDTRQYNHIVWKAAADLAAQLHDRIAATALPKGWVPA
jgi:nucleoside 2-deoxyribosyltransferase